MSADTKTKRLSAIRWSTGSVFPMTLPVGDGEIDTGDRLHLLGLYASGEAAAAPTQSPLVGPFTATWARSLDGSL